MEEDMDYENGTFMTLKKPCFTRVYCELPAVSFVRKYADTYGELTLKFEISCLQEAINNSCAAEFQHKTLALYFHNDADEFSQKLCPLLATDIIDKYMSENFYFLGWDIAEESYHNVLCDMLAEYQDLNSLKDKIILKQPGLFLIVSIQNKPNIFLSFLEPNDLSDFAEKLAVAYKEEGAYRTEIEFKRPALKFIQKYARSYDTKHTLFRECSLKEAINNSCLNEKQNRKALALYLHKDADPFCATFCQCLNDQQVLQLSNNFYFLGWDITDETDNTTIQTMLEEYSELSSLKDRVSAKKPGLFLIIAIQEMLNVCSALQERLKLSTLIKELTHVHKHFKEEIKTENDLANGKEQCINSQCFQQMMFDMLGDRDYDEFNDDDHDHLKSKIGFAYFGPPCQENGYDNKQKIKIDKAFNKICTTFGKFAEHPGKVIISFIWNCLESLPSQKKVKRRKNSTYNPETDICQLPIFVLRKCIKPDGTTGCRVFIDHDLRVYQSWLKYINNIKLHKCVMVLPRNGKYQGNETGNVLLEKHLSPACQVSAKVLRGLDVTTAVLGLGSIGVCASAVIPAITIAPLAAGIVTAAVGVYTVARTSANLVDRHKHDEDLSIYDPEARTAYINILGGALGFVGIGAQTAVTQLVSRGVNIGKTARMAINVINISNVGVNGLRILNNSYEMLYQYHKENIKPSPLAVAQLTSSVLFFGNAVYNFKSAKVLIEETQTKILQSYQEGLRNNKSRKIFNAMKSESVRQKGGDRAAGHAEVISAIRKIPNQDEIFTILTKSSKLFNKENVKLAASDGKITLNGVTVDIIEFGLMKQTDKLSFLTSLPESPPVLACSDTSSLKAIIYNILRETDVAGIITSLAHVDIGSFASILNAFQKPIQEMIIVVMRDLLISLKIYNFDILGTLEKVFPQIRGWVTILRFVANFFQRTAAEYEKCYLNELNEAKSLPDFDENKFHERYLVNPSKMKCVPDFFEKAVNSVFCNGIINELMLRQLSEEFMTFLLDRIVEYEESQKNKDSPETSYARNKVQCTVCSGVYFTS